MSDLIIAACTCFGIGLMTSIHPCPLAVNLSAVSLLCTWNNSQNKKKLTLSFFIIGYLSAFVVLGIVMSFGVVQFAQINNFIQKYLNGFLHIGKWYIVLHMISAKFNIALNPLLHFMQSVGWTIASTLLATGPARVVWKRF